jgi:DNA-directed RNA polymerase subunit RPC12/RpoP
MANLTHWKKLTNPDYLGAYALEPNQDLIVTIKSVSNELVASPDGKKETCSVMSFIENVKPLVLNATNSKTITKLFKTPYIEEWEGRKIQLYVQKGVKAFGDVVDAIRVRPFLPVEKELKCADCGKTIEGNAKSTAEGIAKYTLSQYGRMLCNECGKKAYEAAQNTKKDMGVL